MHYLHYILHITYYILHCFGGGQRPAAASGQRPVARGSGGDGEWGAAAAEPAGPSPQSTRHKAHRHPTGESHGLLGAAAQSTWGSGWFSYIESNLQKQALQSLVAGGSCCRCKLLDERGNRAKIVPW
jgi:hypothetical protein